MKICTSATLSFQIKWSACGATYPPTRRLFCHRCFSGIPLIEAIVLDQSILYIPNFSLPSLKFFLPLLAYLSLSYWWEMQGIATDLSSQHDFDHSTPETLSSLWTPIKTEGPCIFVLCSMHVSYQNINCYFCSFRFNPHYHWCDVVLWNV